MNLTLALLLILCVLSAFLIHRTHQLRLDLQRAEKQLDAAVSAEQLEDTILPLLSELQEGQSTLSRGVSSLAAQVEYLKQEASFGPPAAMGAGARAVDYPPVDEGYEPEESFVDEDASDGGELLGDEEAGGGEAPGMEDFQTLLSGMAQMLGTLRPARPSTATAPPPMILVAGRRRTSLPVVQAEAVEVEEVEEEEQDEAGETGRRGASSTKAFFPVASA